MRQLIDEYRAYLQGLNRATKTITVSIHHLGTFIKFLNAQRIDGMEKVGWQEVEHYLAGLVRQHRYSAVTIEGKFFALKRFFGFLVKTHRVAINPCQDVMAPKVPFRLPREVLSEGEMELLLQQPDTNTEHGLRNRAILETFYSTGIRLAELCRLNLEDVDTGRELLFVRQGKGARDRIVPLGYKAGLWLKAYVQLVRIKHITPHSGNRLFLGSKGNPINLLIIERQMKAYGRQAGITKRVTPHRLRHAFATHLVAAGADLFHVQKLLGHRHIDASQKYISVVEADVKSMQTEYHPRGKDDRG